MVRRMQIGTLGVIGGITLALASVTLAGGFGLSVRLPSGDLKAKNAALLVQVEGCHGPSATASATAEGIVKGQRRSIPLRLTKVATDPVGNSTYSLQRQWPAEGVWVLALTGVSRLASTPNHKGETITCRAMLELGPHGSIPVASTERGEDQQYLSLRYLKRESKEIETALRTMATNEKRNASLTRSAR